MHSEGCILKNHAFLLYILKFLDILRTLCVYIFNICFRYEHYIHNRQYVNIFNSSINKYICTYPNTISWPTENDQTWVYIYLISFILNMIFSKKKTIYWVFIKYCVLVPRMSESLPPLLCQHSAAIGYTKNYQPIGVTVQSHCVESCKRGRDCNELWKKIQIFLDTLYITFVTLALVNMTHKLHKGFPYFPIRPRILCKLISI